MVTARRITIGKELYAELTVARNEAQFRLDSLNRSAAKVERRIAMLDQLLGEES